MKSLEEYIIENKEQLDSEKLNPVVWRRVLKQLKAEKRIIPLRSRIYIYTRAAAVFMAAVLAAYFVFSTQSIKEKAGTDITSRFPNYSAQEKSFSRVIQIKQETVKQLAYGQPEIYHDFILNSKVLTDHHQYLQDQLVLNSNNELLLHAIEENLRLQILLLNRQMELLLEFKHAKNNYEKVHNSL